MTTPTLREAADNLIVLDQCRMTPPDDVFRTSLKLAANTLRVIASAQSDAEKAFEAVWMSFDERDFPMTDDTFLDKEACKRIYAAGLAAQSIPQGMQHQPSVDNQIGYNDVPKATDEQGVPTENAVLRCEWKELTEKLAAQEAKCKELEAERPKRLCDYDPVEATIGDMVTNFGFDYTNFKFLAEGITRYNDALATAKAECEQLKDHCLDAIKVQNEAQADALELANEVRRLRPYREKYIEQCHNIRPGEFDEDFEKRRSDAVLNDRPAAVKAAMERYAETQHG